MDENLLNSLTEIEELKCILKLSEEAQLYLEGFDWCKSIKNSWLDKDFSIYDNICVFLFEIEPRNDTIDDFIWVIAGDLPSVYLDKSVETGKEALEVYCDLMEDWIDNVMNGKSLSESYPVPVEHTKKNAELLITRISFIRQELLMNEE